MRSQSGAQAVLEEIPKRESVGLRPLPPDRSSACAPESRLSIRSFPLSARLFASLMLCVTGACHAVLLVTIWFDTGMNISTIREGYGTFTAVELAQHTFQHLPWFVLAFGFSFFLFALAPGAEKLKRFFAALIPLAIISDFGSMWLIRYHAFFAWQLFASGMVLAASFLFMFVSIQRALWWNGTGRR